jgi:hypothetical protein
MKIDWLQTLNKEIQNLPDYLANRDGWVSLLIEKYPPVIHRLFYRINDDYSIYLHKLFNCHGERAYMHSHSWPFALKLIEGSYEMGVGYSSDRDKPPESTFKTIVLPGNVYEMITPDTWHYTKPLPGCDYSYSVMVVGNRIRPRLAQNTSPLTEQQKSELFDYFENFSKGQADGR